MAVLPHYSPGYPEWDIAEQPRLLESDPPRRRRRCPAQLDVLDSGMLRPKKSLLAVFGLTRARRSRARGSRDLVPCESCSFAAVPVSPRAVSARRAADRRRESSDEPVAVAAPAATSRRCSIATRSYTVNAKALRRWARERLTLDAARRRHDRRAVPLRRHDLHATWAARCASTITCSSARATTATRSAAQRCGPAPGDDGLHLHVPLHRAIGDAADGRRSTRRRRCRRSRSTTCLALDAAGRRRPAATASRRAASTSGAWCSRRFTTRWREHERDDAANADGDAHEDTATRSISRTRPLLGDGAMGTQLMLAGLEQGGCGEAWNLTHPEQGARHPAPLRRGRLRLHHHQHVRRLADHAQPPRPRRRRRRGQQGRRRDRARGVRRRATATCSATSARSAG